ncbi:MAG: PDZ domain-containing protein [Blastocatellia bacterium]
MRRSFAFISLIVVAAAFTAAQTPEPKVRGETKVFSWTFDGGSYLGVQTEEVTRENFSKFGLREVRGVAIDKVVEGSPAQTAGLQDGDVIIKFNGEEVTSTRKLTRLVSEVSPDHTVKITVLRAGVEREISVTVGTRPTPKFEDGAFAFGTPGQVGKMQFPQMPNAPKLPEFNEFPRALIEPGTPGQGLVWRLGGGRQIGVSIYPITKQMGETFGVSGGVMISNVRENSAAAKAGLKAGDIITEVDGKAITNNMELMRAIGEKKEGDATLTIVRDKNRQTIRVTPEEVKGNFEHFFEFPPDAPKAPAQINMPRPSAPVAPVPIDQFLVRGRIV